MIKYIERLCDDGNQDLLLEFCVLAAKCEPVLLRQVLDPSQIEALADHASRKLIEAAEEGDNYSSYGDEEDWWPSEGEYADWHTRAEKILDQARLFGAAFGKELEGELEELQTAIDAASSPPEAEHEDERERDLISESDWTIERIFEDL